MSGTVHSCVYELQEYCACFAVLRKPRLTSPCAVESVSISSLTGTDSTRADEKGSFDGDSDVRQDKMRME